MHKLDKILALGFLQSLQVEVGTRELKKIERRLIKKYNTSLEESLQNNFELFDLVFREIYGAAADAMERTYLENSFNIIKKRTKKNITIEVNNSVIVDNIMEILGDYTLDEIFKNLQKTPMTILQLCQKINMSQPTVYRKIERLSKMGLITIQGYDKTVDDKKVPIYTTTFNSIQINLSNDYSKTILLNASYNKKKDSKILDTISRY